MFETRNHPTARGRGKITYTHFEGALSTLSNRKNLGLFSRVSLLEKTDKELHDASDGKGAVYFR